MKLTYANGHQKTPYNVLSDVKRCTLSRVPHTRSRPWQCLASPSIWTRLGRVAILGENDTVESHSGCVNALHWSADGTVLVSAGDDTRHITWASCARSLQLTSIIND